jgi:hypothetical protein
VSTSGVYGAAKPVPSGHALGSIPPPAADVTVAHYQGHPIVREQDMTRNQARYLLLLPNGRRVVVFADTIGSTDTRKVLRSELFRRNLHNAIAGHRIAAPETADKRTPAAGVLAGGRTRQNLERAAAAVGTAASPPKAVASPLESQARWETWLKEVFPTDDSQRVFYLRGDAHASFVRVVSNLNVVKVEPSSVSVRYQIASLDSARTAYKFHRLNLTLRAESSYLKTRLGTQIQFGRDATQSPRAVRARWIDRGEPILDVVSIEGQSDIALDRKRLEAAWESKRGGSFKAVVQESLMAAGNIRWRRVWEDAVTGERRGIDVTLTAKIEAAATVGFRSGTDQRTLAIDPVIEVNVKYIGNGTKHIDPNWLTRQGADLLAAALFPEERPATQIDSLNHGDPQRARRVSTSHMVFGASPWQLARVSGGRNQGNPAIDLAIRVNAVLRHHGVLGSSAWVSSSAQAHRLLQTLWQRLDGAQRESVALRLANPLGLNFGIVALKHANGAPPPTGADAVSRRKAYRSFFEH